MTASVLPPLIVELKARTTEFTRGMNEARAEVGKMASEGTSKFNQLASVGKAALFGLSTAAVGLGAEAIHLADNYEKSHARLEAAVKASGRAYDTFKPQVSEVSKAMEKLGFTNAQTEEALAHATVALQDPSKALKEMSLAADLARFKNVDLATATDVVDKALAGNLKGLKSMGIDLPIAATNALKLKTAQEAVGKAHEAVTALLAKHADALNVGSKYHAQYEAAVGKVTAAQDKLSSSQAAGGQIIDALTQRLGGQASAHAETFAGKMEILKARSEDLGKNIGLRLIPVIEKVVSVTMDVVQWFEKHKAIAIALGAAIAGTLVAAMGAFVVAAVTAEGSMIPLIATIGAITLAVAAVGLAIYELATHWKQVWSDIKQWVKDAWEWISHHILLVAGLFGPAAPLVAGVLFLAKNWHAVWDDVKAVVKAVWDFVEPIFHAIGTGVKDITKGVSGVAKVAGVLANPGASVAKFLGFADGGPVPGPPGSPRLAVVHGGEFVLSREMLAGNASVPAPVSSGGNAGAYQFTIPVVIDGREVARATARYTQAELLRSKRNNVNVGLS